MQKITPNLWFDDQVEEAAIFYTSLFDDSSIGSITDYGKEGFEIHGQPEGKVMTVDFELAGYKITGLNGGPLFKFTPAISFFVTCETEAEVDALWSQLLDGGTALMALDKYNWSDKYGWVQDRYGLSWQVSLGKIAEVGQKLTPAIMYVDKEGLAEQAIDHYSSVFNEAEVMGMLKYGPGEAQPEGTVKHAQFRLDAEVFMAMDTSPEYADFAFNEAISFLINCKSQEEIDHFWEKLSAGGEEGSCGWLKDKYGVSWQVVPEVLSEMLKDPDPEKVARVTRAFLQMKKFDINTLNEAHSPIQH